MDVTFVPCTRCARLNRVPLSEGARKEPVCGACKIPLPLHFGVAEVNGTGLGALVHKSPLPVVCDFWAPWCGPCKSFAPVFQQAALRFAGKVVFAKLDTEAHQPAGGAYHVRSIPTLILFKEGRERNRISGAVPLDAFEQWLNEGLAG